MAAAGQSSLERQGFPHYLDGAAPEVAAEPGGQQAVTLPVQ
jgi:hypothetical protein